MPPAGRHVSVGVSPELEPLDVEPPPELVDDVVPESPPDDEPPVESLLLHATKSAPAQASAVDITIVRRFILALLNESRCRAL